MLLPYCTPWPSPFPISPIPFQPSSLATFRPGPRLVPPLHTAVFGPQGIHRPALFPPLHLATGLRAPNPVPAPMEESACKKKIKIFRPWDDADERRAPSPSLASSTSFSSPSSITSSTRKVGDRVIYKSIDDKSTGPPSLVDDVDQSKSAFEVFATNLGKSPDGHRCIYCGKMYSRKYGLKIHLRTHTGFKPLKCKVCSRPFGDPSNLNKHVRLHADVLLLQNTDTKQRSIDQSPADQHPDRCISSPHHYPLSVFKCPFCGRSLVRKRDLERHLASRHPDEHLIDVERV